MDGAIATRRMTRAPTVAMSAAAAAASLGQAETFLPRGRAPGAHGSEQGTPAPGAQLPVPPVVVAQSARTPVQGAPTTSICRLPPLNRSASAPGGRPPAPPYPEPVLTRATTSDGTAQAGRGGAVGRLRLAGVSPDVVQTLAGLEARCGAQLACVEALEALPHLNAQRAQEVAEVYAAVAHPDTVRALATHLGPLLAAGVPAALLRQMLEAEPLPLCQVGRLQAVRALCQSDIPSTRAVQLAAARDYVRLHDTLTYLRAVAQCGVPTRYNASLLEGVTSVDELGTFAQVYLPSLSALGLRAISLCLLVSGRDGSQVVEALYQAAPVLRPSLTPTRLLELAQNYTARPTLQRLNKHFGQLRTMGFSAEQTISMCTGPQRRNVVEAVVQRSQGLLHIGLRHPAIVTEACRPSASKASFVAWAERMQQAHATRLAAAVAGAAASRG